MLGLVAWACCLKSGHDLVQGTPAVIGFHKAQLLKSAFDMDEMYWRRLHNNI